MRKETKKRVEIQSWNSFSFLDKARADMTCDVLNGNLGYLVNNNNNNNVTNRPSAKENYKSNGVKANGNLEVPTVTNDEEIATRKSLVILSGIFITSIVAIFYIYKNFPELDE